MSAAPGYAVAMKLVDVRHQDRALSLISRGLAAGRAPHAYLFDGPDGVGKELTARALAARLLCQSAPEAGDQTPSLFGAPEPKDERATDDACGVCESCVLLERGNHPDLHVIHRGLHKHHPDRAIRASKGLMLSVGVVRHFLIDPSSKAPLLGQRRVFIVRDAERMNEEAQNALLKTLEEPPGAATLILVTSAADRLLSTIRSRCQRIAFDPLPRAFVTEKLAESGVKAADARFLAGLCDGRLGAALKWSRMDLIETRDAVRGALRDAGRPEAFGKQVIEAATALAARASVDKDDDDEDEPADPEPGKARKKAKAPPKTVETDALRDGLKLAFMLIGAALRDRLAEQASKADAEADTRLAEGIEAVFDAERMLDRNVAPQLACERLAIALEGGPVGRF
ncbi:MAG: DNA polymerase III subunit [Phycisphaerales bacterium]|nr:DNA polymerase III subunit [Phycisphaerales bacterium]